MSRLFGPIRQNGYVVEDLDAALAHWTEKLGIGPFFRIDHVQFEDFIFKGELTSPDINVALANSGDLQIELIHQVNDALSPYSHFLQNRGPGLHHLSGWSTSFDRDMKALADAGHAPTCTGGLPGLSSIAYFDSTHLDGTVMELSDIGTTPALAENFERIRLAAVDWDGSDPVRAF